MKVIAINDAPIPEKGYYHKGVYYERAYYKGDIFEVYDMTLQALELLADPKDYLIIQHDKLETTMDVDPDNFITLEEHRDKKIDKILN
jgi:hypothetical protein